MTPREAIELRTWLIIDTDAEIAAILRAALLRIQTLLINQPGAAEQWRLTQLDAEIRRILTAAGADAALTVSQQHSAAAAAGTLRWMAPSPPQACAWCCRASAPCSSRPCANSPPPRFPESGSRPPTAWNTQLGLAMVGAQTPYQAVEAVTDVLGESTLARARAIVHSELARAYSTASFERMRQAAADIPGLKKRWVKSGKLHPRENHVAAHGQVRDWDKPFSLGGKITMMYPPPPGRADRRDHQLRLRNGGRSPRLRRQASDSKAPLVRPRPPARASPHIHRKTPNEGMQMDNLWT